MISIKKILAALIATGLITGTVYLGIRSGKDNRFVVWFGIASATAAPTGLALLGYAISLLMAKSFNSLLKFQKLKD